MDQSLLSAQIIDGAPLLSADEITAGLARLSGWTLSADGQAIERSFVTKGFMRAQTLATLAGGIGELANHHPDIAYGWGYCRLRFGTHSAGGVTLNDLICAARVNAVS